VARAIYYLKRWAWLLVLCPILAGGVTLGVVKVTRATHPPMYEATIKLIYGLSNPNGPPGYLSYQTATQLENTYSTLLQSRPVLQDVITQLGLHETPDQLAGQIHVSSQPGNIIALQADASSSAAAAGLVNAVVSGFDQVASALPVAGKHGGRDIAPLGGATVTTIQPTKLSTTTAIIAALLGLAIALAFVALLYYLDDTLFAPDEIARVTDVPLLSAPLPHRDRRSPDDPASADEAARLLLASLRASIASPAVLFCAWTSTRDREPQTLLHLAGAAVRSGLRVILINTDSQYRWLQDLCGIQESPGLADALRADRPGLEPYIVPLAMPGLAAVPAGQSTAETPALLDSPRLERIIAPLRQYVDLALITGAPVLTDPAAAALTRVADGVVVMATARRTRRRDLSAALTVLQRVRARILGIAFVPASDRAAVATGVPALAFTAPSSPALAPEVSE